MVQDSLTRKQLAQKHEVTSDRISQWLLLLELPKEVQQQAMLSSFFVIFPATLLSGFAFPIDNMPGVIRAITVLNPVRYMMTILREIFLKGNGLAVLWPNFLALFLLGTALLTAATMRFKKTL